MSFLKRTLFNAFHFLVAIYACFMLIASVDSMWAQSREEVRVAERISDLSHRLDSFEALRLDQRLIRIETILDQLNRDNWASNATMGGVALLLARAVYAAVKRKEI